MEREEEAVKEGNVGNLGIIVPEQQLISWTTVSHLSQFAVISLH